MPPSNQGIKRCPPAALDVRKRTGNHQPAGFMRLVVVRNRRFGTSGFWSNNGLPLALSCEELPSTDPELVLDAAGGTPRPETSSHIQSPRDLPSCAASSPLWMRKQNDRTLGALKRHVEGHTKLIGRLVLVERCAQWARRSLSSGFSIGKRPSSVGKSRFYFLSSSGRLVPTSWVGNRICGLPSSTLSPCAVTSTGPCARAIKTTAIDYGPNGGLQRGWFSWCSLLHTCHLDGQMERSLALSDLIDLPSLAS
jgi:hypothetical protein